MKLTPMRYKNYTWPHNPRVYSIEFERKMAVHKVPFGRYHLQNLGMTRRVMRGEGEFSGPGAYDAFKKLATVFYDEEPGLLVHPVWQTTSAYFVSLALKQEPREDYVSYTFTFWEDYTGHTTQPVSSATGITSGKGATEAQGGEEKRYHTVVKGESLWGIAARYGLEFDALIALNSQIANPNRIYPGQQVRVA